MKKVKKRGRPSKYKPEYCKAIVDFFDIEPHREVEIITTGKNGYEKIDTKLVPNRLPTFNKFARSIKVNEDTVVEWAKVHKDFSASYNIAKAIQKEFLVDNGLAGLYPPASFIFTAKNITDMRDVSSLEHSGPDNTPIPINIIKSLSKYYDEEE